MIIDIHTHAFPDELAERAMARLQAETDVVTAVLDGTVGDLLASMDRAGVDASVVASIATKPAQFEPILKWSGEIRSDRIVPFPSIHPADPEAPARIRRIADEGFRGIKMHPYYQQFEIDEERMAPIYTALEDCGLALLMHAGFDIAFPHDRIADPIRAARVVERFPRLNIVLAHLGAWEDWDEVRRHLIGRPVYLNLSFSIHMMDPKRAREMILAHPAERLLFGSDSPWMDQAETIGLIRGLELGEPLESAILGGNARRLLGV